MTNFVIEGARASDREQNSNTAEMIWTVGEKKKIIEKTFLSGVDCLWRYVIMI